MDLENLAGYAVNVLNAATNSLETVEIQLPQPSYQPRCALYILRDTTLRLPVPSDFPNRRMRNPGLKVQQCQPL